MIKGQSQRFIGILMLDTHFPRIPGDVGNPSTFDFPVRFRVISGATVEAVVRRASPDDELNAQFIKAALAFEAEGAEFAPIIMLLFPLTIPPELSPTRTLSSPEM